MKDRIELFESNESKIISVSYLNSLHQATPNARKLIDSMLKSKKATTAGGTDGVELSKKQMTILNSIKQHGNNSKFYVKN